MQGIKGSEKTLRDVEAIKPMPHWFDKPLRGQSTDDPWTDSGGGGRDLYEDAAPIFMRYASGHSGIMRFFARRH